MGLCRLCADISGDRATSPEHLRKEDEVEEHALADDEAYSHDPCEGRASPSCRNSGEKHGDESLKDEQREVSSRVARDA